MTNITLDAENLRAPALFGSSGAAASRRPWDGLRRRLSPLLRRAEPAPTRSPWGEVAEAAPLAPGLLWFRAGRRAGYRLSAARQRALPHYLRSHDGWYGDAVEWAGVAVVFPRIFDPLPAGDGARSLYDLACDTLRDWRPEAYEAWFQTSLDMDEIWSCALMRFHREHRDDWIACDPPLGALCVDARGRTALAARPGGDPPYGASLGLRRGPTRRFAAPLDELHARRGRPFLIDLSRHEALDAEEQESNAAPFPPARGWDAAAGFRAGGL